MAADPPASAPPPPRNIPWDLVLQAVGLVAAVAGWVAVVGGARVWARLEAAQIPATQTLAGLPRELFVVEGLQMLLVPLLLGGVVATFVFFSLRHDERLAEETERRALQAEGRAQERLALAEADAERTASAEDEARSALEEARAAADEAEAGTESREPTPDDQAAARVRDAEARLSSAIDDAEQAKRQLRNVQNEARQASRYRYAAQVAADRFLARANVNGDPRAGPPSWRSAPSQVVDRYGAERAGLIAAVGTAALLLTALRIAEIRGWILGVAALVAVVLGAGVWLRTDAVWGVLTALAGLSVGGVVALLDAVTFWTIVAMVAITLAAIWLLLLALARRRAGGAALTLFAVVALWSGALAFAQERGDRRPDLERVRVEMTDRSLVPGYFLGRSSDRVYVAQDSKGSTARKPRRHVVVLDAADVERVVYGGEDVLPEVAQRDQADEAAEDGNNARRDAILDAPLPQTEPGPEEQERTGPAPGGEDRAPGSESEPLPEREPKGRPLDSRIDGVPAQFQVLELARRGGVLELDARVVNLSDVKGPPRDFRVDDSFDDGNARDARSDTVDGLWLLDFRNRRLYLVDVHDRECACERNLSEAVVKPGQARHLSASFVAPAEGVDELDLVVPGFGFIRGVPVE